MVIALGLGAAFLISVLLVKVVRRRLREWALLRALVAEKGEQADLLRVANERLEAAVAGTSDGLWDWNVSTGAVWYSHHLWELLGFPAHAPMPPSVLESARDRLHPDDVEAAVLAFSDFARSGSTLDLELRLRMEGGGYRWFRVRGRSQRGPDGRITRMAGNLHDIEARRNAESQLRDNRALLSRVSQVSGVGGWMLDLADKSVVWTPETFKIHEVPDDYQPNLEAALGFYAAEARPLIAAALERGIQDATPWDLELAFVTAKGRARWVRAVGEIEFEEGSARRAVGAFLDVTERRNAEDAHREMARLAEAASRAKSDFLATMSHEIRTPMNGLIGFADLLLDTPLSIEQRGYVNTLRNSGESLLTIINDVLDFSKIEAGKFNLESLSFDLAALVAEVTQLLSPAAREQGVTLSTAFEPMVPRVVVADPIRVRQVLLNLMGNALKFTRQGSVQVRTALCGGNWRVSVTDTGIGISPQAQSKLFTAFTQGDTSTARRFGGTGLGLSICRRLIEMMGGQIGITSELGVGSTFWFEVPLVEGTLVAVAPLELSGLSSGLRVLVAEDNPVNQRLIVALLSKLGCVAHLVSDGRAAIEAHRQQRFDVTLMDCHMPEVDGYEATVEIRRHEATSGARVPIIALTASVLQTDREHCRSAGMDDFLSKPVTLGALSQTLAKWVAPTR
jgi:signal transduction histidine kinase/CheY-like chemotaxis protein